MKKKRIPSRIVRVLCVFLVLMIPFIPIRSVKKDGGTVCYDAIAYRIINWNHMYIAYESEDAMKNDQYTSGTFRKRVFYWRWEENGNKSLDALWEQERQQYYEEYHLSIY